MSPQDTIEHTHLRDPEKRVRRYVDEEIASDGKWRKKQLTAKEKNMRCQLYCQAIGVPRAGRGRPGYTKALEECLRRKKEIGPKTVKLCRCGQMLHVQTNGASADKWQNKCGQMLHRLTNVACSEKCCRSSGRRKGNERAEIRSTTMKNHENPERERKKK